MEKFDIFFRLKTKILRKITSLFKYRLDSFPFISGDGFRKIANFIYDETKKFKPEEVKNGNIIFVASPFIKEYFTDIHPQIKYPYKLITHNGDDEVGELESKYIDDKIIHWFAQNNTFTHQKITPIPIGIENRKWFMSGYVLYKDYKKLKRQEPQKKDRILFGFNPKTNPKERLSALSELRGNTIADEITKRLSPKEYFNLLNQYKFVASPPGNGVDCHRTWEAIYLDVIPLVKGSVCMEYFKDLGIPLYIVNQYSMIELHMYKKVNTEIMYMNYWINKIKK
jgi:hypothetical protein